MMENMHGHMLLGTDEERGLTAWLDHSGGAKDKSRGGAQCYDLPIGNTAIRGSVTVVHHSASM